MVTDIYKVELKFRPTLDGYVIHVLEWEQGKLTRSRLDHLSSTDVLEMGFTVQKPNNGPNIGIKKDTSLHPKIISLLDDRPEVKP